MDILQYTTNIGGQENGSAVYMGATSGGTVYDDACWSFTVPGNSKWGTLTFTLKYTSSHFYGYHTGYLMAICTKGSKTRGYNSNEKLPDNFGADWVIAYQTLAFGQSGGGTYTVTFNNLELEGGETYYIRGSNDGKSTYKDIVKTFYAIDLADQIQYTVTYDANEGENAPAPQSAYYNEALTITSSEPTRSGYDFLGWATSSSAETADYLPGESYTINTDVTVYAVWRVQSCAKVWTNNKWNMTMAYVWTNNELKQAVPYVYTNGQWRNN